MNLQPLRIATGWKVEYNLFYEIDPIKGFENFFDGSSLLILKNEDRLKIIDVCWRPELDLNGEYQIEVLNYHEDFNSKTNTFDANVNWEKPYLTFKTKNRLELVARLEQLMEQLPIYNDPRILEKRGIVDEPSESYRIKLQEIGLDDNLISQILDNGNSKIQNLILDHKNITRDIVLKFFQNGVSKKVKNKANQKLNSKYFKYK